MAKSFNKNKAVLTLILVAFLAIVGFAFSARVFGAKAEVNPNFVMRRIAELRLIDGTADSGIRFSVDMDETTKNKVASSSEFGFIIAPTANFEGVTDFHSIDCVNVAFDERERAENVYFDSKSGTYRANGVLVGILDKNYDLEFSAVAYYKETPASDYVYAVRGENPVSVSVKQLGEAVYSDGTLNSVERAEKQKSVRTYIGTGANETRAIGVKTETDFANMTQNSEPVYYVLENDVTLTAVTLGNGKKENIFDSLSARLDGNGNKLVFNIDYGTDIAFNGLFDTIEEGASVKNLYLKANLSSGWGYEQGIIAESLYGVLDSCIFDVYIGTVGAISCGIANTLYDGSVISNCIYINDCFEPEHKLISRKYESGAVTVRNFVYAGNMHKRNTWNKLPEVLTNAALDVGKINYENIYTFLDLGSAIGGIDGYKLIQFTARDGDLNVNRLQHEWADSTDKLGDILDSETLVVTETEDYITLKLKDKIIVQNSLIEYIATAEEFIAAVDAGSTAKLKLTADIAIGSADNPFVLADDSTRGDQLFRSFNGTLEGDGHKLTIYVDASDCYGAGIFGTINGTIRNLITEFKFITVNNMERVQGIFAQTLNGKIDTCIINFADGFDDHTYNMGLFGHLGANSEIKNCLINAGDASGNIRLFGATTESTAKVDGVAYVKANYLNYQNTVNWMLPKTKMVINNLYIANTMEQAANGAFIDKLVDSYNDGNVANGPDLWDSNATTPLSSVITGIEIVNGVARFTNGD